MIAPDIFLISLRESLEAFLIISILSGLVTKMGFPQVRKTLLYGAGAAIAFSIVAGVLIDRTIRSAFEGGANDKLFEGVAALIAVGILTYMIVWMYKHTLDLVGELRRKTHEALEGGKPGVMFAIAFVAVAREGLETVLFVATTSNTTALTTLWISLLLGIAVSGIIAFLLFTGVIRLNLKKFFAITGVILIFFAGGLLLYSLHEFEEAGVIPATRVVWDTQEFLDHKENPVGILLNALIGYRHKVLLLEAFAYFAYIGGMLWWFLSGVVGRHRPKHGEQDTPEDAVRPPHQMGKHA